MPHWLQFSLAPESPQYAQSVDNNPMDTENS